MGNGKPASGDGSKYLGKGCIHLTGKDQYKTISDIWNADIENANNHKQFDGKDIDELTTNLEIAMKASMYYWNEPKKVKIGSIARTGNGNKFADEDESAFVNQFVNGGQNNAEERLRIKNQALKILKKRKKKL